MEKFEFTEIIEEKRQELIDAMDFIWDHPETAFTEFESAKYLCALLEKEGFTVEKNLAGIETAFSGRFGSGKPVIGFLGEFDALSGLGQASGCTTQTPDGHENGHGCGHNNLGVGSIAAAMAVKDYLQKTGKSGTVIFFGCPGEEGGSGKAFMARDGVFDELDAAISWHPFAVTGVRVISSLANCQVLYKFDGKASHAGQQPHLGRSALDAVELMDVGVNYMREHMPSDARVHYAITDAGGFSPNVVQPHAEVLYLIRGSNNEQVKELYNRVTKIAEGAALMTETKVTVDFVKACSNCVLNEPMQRRMQSLMEQLPPPEPTKEDIAFARELTQNGLQDSPKHDEENPIHWQLDPYHHEVGHGSTDVGDVSWVCPTAQIRTATLAFGTPNHSWQQVTQGKMPLAHKMTLYAAKIMGQTGIDLMEEPALLQAAKEEHRRLVGPKGYECPIPQGVKPRPLTSFKK